MRLLRDLSLSVFKGINLWMLTTTYVHGSPACSRYSNFASPTRRRSDILRMGLGNIGGLPDACVAELPTTPRELDARLEVG